MRKYRFGSGARPVRPEPICWPRVIFALMMMMALPVWLCLLVSSAMRKQDSNPPGYEPTYRAITIPIIRPTKDIRL